MGVAAANFLWLRAAHVLDMPLLVGRSAVRILELFHILAEALPACVESECCVPTHYNSSSQCTIRGKAGDSIGPKIRLCFMVLKSLRPALLVECEQARKWKDILSFPLPFVQR